MTDKRVVLVTCGSAREAAEIGKAMVEAGLAACANVVTVPVMSIYRWKGKVEKASERMMILKTTRRKFPELKRAIAKLHSYDVPEIIALPIADGLEAYLEWIAESTSAPRRRSGGRK